MLDEHIQRFSARYQQIKFKIMPKKYFITKWELSQIWQVVQHSQINKCHKTPQQNKEQKPYYHLNRYEDI